MKTSASLAVAAVLGLILVWQPSAQAQGSSDNPECVGTSCGAPQTEGGGCGCGCGCSVWVAQTDYDTTLSFTDDRDGDGIADWKDNCVTVPNHDQKDSDGDGVGDACDNCPLVYNPTQLITASCRAQGRTTGAACTFNTQGELDADCDGIGDRHDNCSLVANPSQTQSDPAASLDPISGLKRGDDCNTQLCAVGHRPDLEDCQAGHDRDHDGVPDRFDNCPDVYNPDQTDTGNKGIGDACATGPDQDRDGDGVVNRLDNCPGTPNPDQRNSTGFHEGDACNGRPRSQFKVGDVCLAGRSDCLAGEVPDGDVLDFQAPFTISGGGTHRLGGAGQRIVLPIYANRNGAPIQYTWTVVGGSGAVSRPIGVVTQSDHNLYKYESGQEATFTPPDPGNYTLQLAAKLLVADRAYPDVTTSTSTLTLQVGGGSSGGGHAGCAAVPAGLPAIGVGFALLGILRRRRR
jgi:hypothetical protein